MDSGRRLRSFGPIYDKRSRILILDSLPGPEALRRREYYGYPGNHFWRLLAELFQRRPIRSYAEKKAFLHEEHIALWDVVGSCVRRGAADSSIRGVIPNPVDRLVRRLELRAVFLNGSLAERLYRRYFASSVSVPAIRLPSTSPANASVPYASKLAAWAQILPYLENRNPWC